MDAPKAKKIPTTITLHRQRITDHYAWLRDPDWQNVMTQPALLDAGIRAYLESENTYTQQQMADTESLQEALFQEIKGRIKLDDSSVPSKDGNYSYFTQFSQTQQYPSYCRVHYQTGTELLLDANVLAQSHEYFHIRSCEHSPNHKYMAYSVDVSGYEIYQIHIIEIGTGRAMIPPLQHTQGDFAWSGDSRCIFFTTLDHNHRPDRVFRCDILQPDQMPTQVYEEKDAGFFVGLSVTESGRYVVIHAHDHTTSECHLFDAHQPTQAARIVHPREAGLKYEVSDHGDYFYILTNADDCKDYKIMRCTADHITRDGWHDYYVPETGTLLESMLLFKDWIVRLERRQGLAQICVERLGTRAQSPITTGIQFDEEAYELQLIPGYEFESDLLRFAYTSMSTPEQIFDYDMHTGLRVLRKQQEIPSGYHPEDYVTRRLMAMADDGELIPISLIHHKKHPPKPASPLLLYGYGAYGISIPAEFSPARFSLLNRGFSYAIAHIRGGMEMGYRWYQDGKLDKKNNTFNDFIACAQYLIAEGYSSAGNIAIHGGSAGGMLIGVVVNRQPQLYRCALADVPFVDVLNTMCDASLPLTPAEWPEWGNPLESADDFARIADYSPYDNIRTQAYPHMLVTAGLTDPRVTYWEPAKWVARLREHKTDSNLLLLKTNMSAGHGGASGRFEHLREVALHYAFLLKVFEIET